MISQDSRLCLAVENFFAFCNWEGQSLTIPTQQFENRVSFTPWQWLSVEDFLISGTWEGQTRQQQREFANQDWQCLAVEKFFGECCNWEGQPLASNDRQLSPLSWDLTAKVSDFVQYIPWDGKTEIGALPKWSTSSMSVFDVAPAFTNLSELF